MSDEAFPQDRAILTTLEQIQRVTWIKGHTRKAPLLMTDILLRSYAKKPPFINEFCQKNIIYLYEEGIQKSYRDQDDYELFKKEILEHYKGDYKAFIAAYQKRCAEEITIIERMNQTLDEKGFTQEITEAFTVLQYPVFLAHLVEEGILQIDEKEFQILNQWRDKQAKAGWRFVDEKLPQLIRKAAELIHTDQSLAEKLTLPELTRILKGKTIEQEILQQRKKLTALVQLDGHLKVLTGREAEKIKETVEKPEVKTKDELQGRPAYPGIVKGPICKVDDQTKAGDITEGCILATPMTTIHFTPYLHKVKGILTEEGGLTCHAAIMARELCKPTIVGVKGLMKAVENGELVELDAQKGTIKKLSTER